MVTQTSRMLDSRYTENQCSLLDHDSIIADGTACMSGRNYRGLVGGKLRVSDRTHEGWRVSWPYKKAAESSRTSRRTSKGRLRKPPSPVSTASAGTGGTGVRIPFLLSRRSCRATNPRRKFPAKIIQRPVSLYSKAAPNSAYVSAEGLYHTVQTKLRIHFFEDLRRAARPPNIWKGELSCVDIPGPCRLEA